ncbi:MAG: DUF362 domain-containing protein [Rhodospirillales bacterium]|jgi:uncharacterized protein (DUF362 family)|nr:DUF362 domain-containing protein [Rhodospirillales bacterium]
MDRRKFLNTSAKGAVALGASFVPPISLAASHPDIAVVKGAPGAATRAAVEMIGGMGSVVGKGHRVVIKPNMSFASGPEVGANTHPMVVQAIAAMCWEAGASSVLILDHTLAPGVLCLERSGVKAAAAAVKDDMVYMVNDSDHYSEVEIDGGKNLKETEIVKSVLRADVLIAAPTAKSHSGAGVSLSLKGMMGLIYDRGTLHWKGLDSCIVDLCTVLRADLSVIDGTHVLSTNGPRGPGKVLNENTVIASRDMVAADAQAVAEFTWYGKKFQPRQVAHIRHAHERGMGRMDIENLRVERLAL